MRRKIEVLRIVREAARELAALQASLDGGANILDAQYCAERAKVMHDALASMSCEIWALEDQIALGRVDLPKVA